MLTAEDIAQIMQTVVNSGNLPRIFLSGGEPTLHPNLGSILDIIVRSNCQLTLMTNGTTLTPELADYLRETGVMVQVTLTGATPDQDAFLRGKGAFERSIEGIRFLSGLGERLSVSVALHRHNVDYMEAIVSLLTGLGVQKLGFSTVIPKGRAANIPDLCLSTGAVIEAAHGLSRVRERYRHRVTIHTSGFAFAALPSLLHHQPVVLGCMGDYESSISNERRMIPCEFWTSAGGPELSVEDLLGRGESPEGLD